ncbi:hypothetical protein F-VV57_0372 [Faustovirus]|nr:hypothetical protein F-VV57_0372 [Faustovirus]QJX73640.1 hypothetical protein F-VV63_0374 [Faustovirus]
MNAKQEQDLDERIMIYVGTKLIRVGDFMMQISRVGAYMTTVLGLFNYSFARHVLQFSTRSRLARINNWSDEVAKMEYYGIDEVNEQVKRMVNCSHADSVLAGATVVCGAIGAALAHIGHRLRCRGCDIGYLLEKSKNN